MGREIRHVPANWQHPKDSRGHYKPLYNASYQEAAERWIKEFTEWQAPENAEKRKEYDCPYFWDWDGPPPDKEYHRPNWSKDEATHYQVYETVSEGTPTSPVFASKDEMQEWLIGEGYSESAAANFCRDGWAPSMLLVTGVGAGIGIHSCDDKLMNPKFD